MRFEINAMPKTYKITRRAFLRRLNPVIREALRASTDVIVIDIRESLMLETHQDLTDTSLKQSLIYLEYLGIMTYSEYEYVLNTPVTKNEV